MNSLRFAFASAITFILLNTACDVPDKQRLNSPPAGYAEPPHPMAANYAYHNDQGLLADLSIADIHFVPHTAELSGVGEARLERYAELLAHSGGTIHYDSSLPDKILLDARLAAANAFLCDAIPGMKPIKVAMGGAGGRGMTTAEASAAKAVAKQPEPRKSAYSMAGKIESSSK